jgi:uncharacterized protein involved in exopolysaccharide biosynthesis
MTHADAASRAGDAQELARAVTSLQQELATLRKEVESIRRERSAAAPDPALQALRSQQAAWDQVLGLSPEVHQRRTEAAARSPSFEDAGARFLSQHAGKVWLFLALLAVLAVTFRDRLAGA